MTDFYDEESRRFLAFHTLIFNHFGVKLEAANVTTTQYPTDGHAPLGFHVYANMVAKNENGTTPADPAIQSAVYYHYQVRPFVTEILGSRFPCIHIYYFSEAL
jgi:hypothetical protein